MQLVTRTLINGHGRDIHMYDSKKYHHDYYIQHKEVILKRQHEWYLENHERVLEHQREYNRTHKEQDRVSHKRWRDNNRERFLGARRLRDAKARLTILKHYSGFEIPKCNRCGFSDIRALTLDHINGNGHDMRKKHGSHERWWIIKNKFPEGYQVLCINCQFIKDKKYSESLLEISKKCQ